ncbi:MFS transporter [Sphingobacterium hungaricum]|nr:MFS transporter [Sphingobacterium hungaricum]
MTISTGLIVANNYYNQPLLGLMAKDFNVQESMVSKIAVLTQMGYAFGLLFIIPLGDMVLRKRLILVDLVLVIVALLGMAKAPTLNWLFVMSFLVGFTSVIPQIFVPMAAELSSPETRAKNIGLVMSGLLFGVLLSRVVSGFIGDVFGWRDMYYLAAGVMVCIWVLVYFTIPEVKPNFKGSYRELMKSVFTLARTQPVLQLAAFRGAMGFAAMSAVFTTLVFHLEEPPFYAGSSVAGSFGVIGAVGALAAAFVGKLTFRFTTYKLILYALLILLSSWVFIYFGGYSYIGLIIGIILVDLGLQASHILNQTDYFALNIGANNRLNTVYMFCYFVGGSIGTLSAAYSWEHYGWTGVCAVGAGFSLMAILAHVLFSKRIRTTAN